MNKWAALLEYFKVQGAWTLDELAEINVPSVYFPDKKELLTTLDRAVAENKIQLDDSGVYRFGSE